MKNAAALAADLLASGSGAEASKLASGVLKAAHSTVEDREKAARVYGKAAADLVGSPEMQAIQGAVRTGSAGDAATKTYYSALRRVLLEKAESPSLDLLLAQKYTDPDSKDLSLRLFEAFRNSDRCEPAMWILDPAGTASSSEYDPPRENEYQDEYYAYYGYYNPIEKLSLAEDQTKDLALSMAECAGKTGDMNGRVYFLSMALNHAAEGEDRKSLGKLLEEARAKLRESQETEERRFKVTANLGREP
jgi:hypothetical protein